MIAKLIQKYAVFLISVGLVVTTFAVYEPVRHNGFVGYDDNDYITANPDVRAGLTRQSLGRAFAFSQPSTALWHPLTTLSQMLDCQLFGLNSVGHHFVSVLFHIANALLLFLILTNLTGALWPSAFAAAVFALHPLQVDAVAWASERKTVLSGLFVLLTIAAYAGYAKKPGIGRYLLVFAVYGLCIMTKPIVVTLPFVLLLLDYWPLLRFATKGRPLDQISNQQSSISNLFLEKVPLLALSALLGIVTFKAQQIGSSVISFEDIPLGYRIENMFVSYMRYICKMIWPAGLTVFYPHPTAGLSKTAVVASVALFMLITAFCIYFYRRKKYLITGWLWFVGTLIPVIGLVQSGGQAMANRYMYLSMLGLLFMLAWGINDLLAGMPFRKIVFSLSAAAALLPLVFVSRQQVGFWRDDVSLFRRATEVVPDNWWAEQLLGNAYAQRGRFDEAINSYRETLRIVPGSLEVTNDLARILLQQAKLDEVIELYQKTLPELPNTGVDPLTLVPNTVTPPKPESGKLALIIRCYTEAHFNLGEALSRQERGDEAIKHYAEAIRIKPDYLIARQALAKALILLGRADFAIEQLEKCLLIAPDSIDIRATLATVLLSKNRTDEAILQAGEIMQLQPDSPLGFYTLATVYQKQGKIADAIEAFGRAVELAKAAGQETLAKQIQAQIETLKSK
ncbi:MAG: tetratricopeptide repeat protein [Sedimentisphaerales bacterium]